MDLEIGVETKRFIAEHGKDDVRNLALHPGRAEGVDLPFALSQIEGRQIARRKLPSLAQVEGILYPPHISMEQCSSEPTALYKSSLVEGGSLVDLTGGFGIDCSYMAKRFSSVIYVERNQNLSAVAQHNFMVLGLNHIEVRCDDATSFLLKMPKVDCIYLDPARRDNYGRKTVSVVDCEPDVSALQEGLFEHSPLVLIKYSPMLDLSLALQSLQNVTEVHVVSVDNECKELLFKLERDTDETELKIVCVNLKKDGQNLFSFTKKEEESSSCRLADSVQKYLYEPNVSLLKGGAYRLLTQRFPVSKLDVNTHLYTSDECLADFPGRAFEVESSFQMNKAELKQGLAGLKMANLTVRNFPQTVAELRSRLKLKEGGDVYLFAATLKGDRRLMIRCKKVCG